MGAAFPPPNLAASSAADSPWLLPGDALERVEAIVGQRQMAIETLLGSLKAGRLTATYNGASWENTAQVDTIDQNKIERKFWQYFHNYHESGYVWKTSTLKLFLRAYARSLTHDNVYLTFFEVRFERKGIEAIIANLPTPSSPLAKASKASPSNQGDVTRRIGRALRQMQSAELVTGTKTKSM
ncbi:MAG: hypothetical protein WAV27_21085, partial [Xanthobacteraceae bacterium]